MYHCQTYSRVIPCATSRTHANIEFELSESRRMAVREGEMETTRPINMVSPQQGIAVRCSRTTRKSVTPKRPLLSISSVKASPDGGIAIGPSDGAYTSLTNNNILTDHGYAQPIAAASGLPGPNEVSTSPSRLANIRVRRANNGSALLQSPARAGHAARMRQIFEDAGRDHTRPQSQHTISYPQLPNISRKASPAREYNRDEQSCTPTSSPIRRPESLCMSISPFRMVQHRPQLNSPHISEQSSESWSDDSGYFIAGSWNRTSSLTVLPRDRINDWLTNVSECVWETPTVEDEIEGQAGNFPSPQPSPASLTDINILGKDSEQSSSAACDAIFQDPFLDFDSTSCTPTLFKALPPRRVPTLPPTHSTESVTIRTNPSPTKRSILEDGGIQLSPLSPNVCIERGPARYHSTRTPPIKERRTLRFDENKNGAFILSSEKRDGEAEAQGSPLAPCKIGAGTRFQHPRHGARSLGRFRRCLES